MSLADVLARTSTTPLMRAPGPLQVANPTYGTYQLNKAKLDLVDAGKKIAAREGKRDLLLEQRATAESNRQAAENQQAVLDKVLILLQKTSDFARQQIKGRMEELVSQALNIIYGGNHKFIIDLVVRSNRPEADYLLNENGVITKLEKPDYDNGGGKIDVISLTLRLAIDELVGDEGPLFLDEVGKHVDGEAAINLAYFLKQYAEKFGRQLCLITHNTTLETIGDVSYRVTKDPVTQEAKVKGGARE